MTQPPPGLLSAALGAAWDQLRSEHPELPPATVATAPGAAARNHGPERWHVEGGVLQGLVVHRDTLSEGAEETLTCLFHDAAHVLNWVRGIKDTTIRGAYHNAEYRRAALEVGLAWIEGAERVEGRGFISLELPTETRERYLPHLTRLAEAIPVTLPYLALPPRRSDAPPQRLTAECRCLAPRKIKVAPTVLERGPIVCGICGENFLVRD